jgi:hypothetical protein
MEVNFNNIRKNMQMRKGSDRRMSIIWLLVYLLPLIIIVIFLAYLIASFSKEIFSSDISNPQSYEFLSNWVSQDFFLVSIAITIFLIINLFFSVILNYLLINRQRTHFVRQKSFFENLFKLFNSYERTIDVTRNDELLALKEIIKEDNYGKTEKNPILWSVLSVIVPFIQFYVYYFLMNDIYQHEKREANVWKKIKNILTNLGFNFSIPTRKKAIPYRSFVLYFILTVVTAGFFLIYWIFVLLKDPNLHFNYHILVEDKLLDVLKSF